MATLPSSVALVTGANVGIGKEVVKGLLQHGFTVVMACRSMERAEAAKREILKAENKRRASPNTSNASQWGISPRDRPTQHPVGDDKLIPLPLDLASFRSIQQFSSDFQVISTPLLDWAIANYR